MARCVHSLTAHLENWTVRDDMGRWAFCVLQGRKLQNSMDTELIGFQDTICAHA